MNPSTHDYPPESPLLAWLRNFAAFCDEQGWKSEARRVDEAADALEEAIPLIWKGEVRGRMEQEVLGSG